MWPLLTCITTKLSTATAAKWAYGFGIALYMISLTFGQYAETMDCLNFQGNFLSIIILKNPI